MKKNPQYVGKSTILLEKEVIELINKVKLHPRQTYNEAIRNICEYFLRNNLKAEEIKNDGRYQ